MWLTLGVKELSLWSLAGLDINSLGIKHRQIDWRPETSWLVILVVLPTGRQEVCMTSKGFKRMYKGSRFWECGGVRSGDRQCPSIHQVDDRSTSISEKMPQWAKSHSEAQARHKVQRLGARLL